MKKLFCILLCLFMAFSTVCHASEYYYFSSGEMSVEIDSSSIAVLNGCTYATDRQGNLYGTHIFSEWILMEYAPKNCRIISTQRPDETKLLLYSENTLYVTYDGYGYTAVETFAEGSVLRHINGMYTAMHKTDAGYHLRYSFDGLAWYDIKETLSAPTLSVLRIYEDMFLLKNISFSEGTKDILFTVTSPTEYTVHDHFYFAFTTGYSFNIDENEEAIYAAKTQDNLYLHITRTKVDEQFVLYKIGRLNPDRSLHSKSTLIADNSYDLYVFNNTVCLAKDGQSLNLINTGDAQWHQVTDDVAFPLLKNAYGLCGDVFFDGGYTKTYYYRNEDALPTATSGIEIMLGSGSPAYLAFDSAPQLINDRTMVPIRTVAEALDCTVNYDGATQAIHIQKSNGITLDMTVGQPTAKITWADGISAPIQLDSAPVVINGRTLVPLRFIGESLDLTVEWVEETQTVVLK